MKWRVFRSTEDVCAGSGRVLETIAYWNAENGEFSRTFPTYAKAIAYAHRMAVIDAGHGLTP